MRPVYWREIIDTWILQVEHIYALDKKRLTTYAAGKCRSRTAQIFARFISETIYIFAEHAPVEEHLAPSSTSTEFYGVLQRADLLTHGEMTVTHLVHNLPTEWGATFLIEAKKAVDLIAIVETDKYCMARPSGSVLPVHGYWGRKKPTGKCFCERRAYESRELYAVTWCTRFHGAARDAKRPLSEPRAATAQSALHSNTPIHLLPVNSRTLKVFTVYTMPTNSVVQVSWGSSPDSGKERYGAVATTFVLRTYNVTTTSSTVPSGDKVHSTIPTKPHTQALPNATLMHTSFERHNSSSSATSKLSIPPLSHSHSSGSNVCTNSIPTLATGGSRLSVWSTRYRVGLSNMAAKPADTPKKCDDTHKKSRPEWIARIEGWVSHTQAAAPFPDLDECHGAHLMGAFGAAVHVAVSCAYAVFEESEDAPIKRHPPRKLISTSAPVQWHCSHAQANNGRDARGRSSHVTAVEDVQTVLNATELFDDEVYNRTTLRNVDWSISVQDQGMAEHRSLLTSADFEVNCFHLWRVIEDWRHAFKEGCCNPLTSSQIAPMSRSPGNDRFCTRTIIVTSASSSAATKGSVVSCHLASSIIKEGSEPWDPPHDAPFDENRPAVLLLSEADDDELEAVIMECAEIPKKNRKYPTVSPLCLTQLSCRIKVNSDGPYAYIYSRDVGSGTYQS
ncbi:hypothetical protein OBBRIDRAFT_801959 [Obba rivulosa]|uniref:Uncharacterized protein n=1 Tax=Obba rivulosa TaxID=1052685 RepID=A0A8E2DPE9_9APHY|nr:hypothetical protein OBBRIDRAFT_801959 [Obba rivulosa]